MKASCGTLCQHPECWRADLKRVKEAVRARNGIVGDDEDSEFTGDRELGRTYQDNDGRFQSTSHTAKAIAVSRDHCALNS